MGNLRRFRAAILASNGTDTAHPPAAAIPTPLAGACVSAGDPEDPSTPQPIGDRVSAHSRFEAPGLCAEPEFRPARYRTYARVPGKAPESENRGAPGPVFPVAAP